MTAQTEENYLAKLVLALGHPESETRIRAAALAAKALEDQSYLVRLAAVAAVRDLLATGSTLDEQLRERVQAVAREDPSAGVREAAKTLLSSHILST